MKENELGCLPIYFICMKHDRHWLNHAYVLLVVYSDYVGIP